MNDCVAVFDLGKTNIKVVAFDGAGKVVGRARPSQSRSLPPDSRWPYRRLDTEGAWAFLVGGAERESALNSRSRAISISAHGAAGVLVDGRGRRAAGHGL